MILGQLLDFGKKKTLASEIIYYTTYCGIRIPLMSS